MVHNKLKQVKTEIQNHNKLNQVKTEIQKQPISG